MRQVLCKHHHRDPHKSAAPCGTQIRPFYRCKQRAQTRIQNQRAPCKNKKVSDTQHHTRKETLSPRARCKLGKSQKHAVGQRGSRWSGLSSSQGAEARLAQARCCPLRHKLPKPTLPCSDSEGDQGNVAHRPCRP